MTRKISDLFIPRVPKKFPKGNSSPLGNSSFKNRIIVVRCSPEEFYKNTVPLDESRNVFLNKKQFFIQK